ncbi:MAG: hypothetical protein KDD47_14920 [Acidobacteria bacterium]|nr:hypothetical protein [Acidobacteriota bacterium]
MLHFRLPLAFLAILLPALAACSERHALFGFSGGQPPPAAQSLEELASRLSRALSSSEVETLAVASFVDPTGASSDLRPWLEDALTNKLAALGKRPELYERERLSDVLRELELQATGWLDTETAAKLGRFSGVGAVVYGSFSRQGDFLVVTARITYVDTAKVETAVTALLSTKDVPSSGSTPDHPAPSQASKPPKEVRTWEAGPLRLEVTRIERQFDRKRATVYVDFINRTPSTIFVAVEKEGRGLCSATLKDQKGSAHQPLAGGRGATIACVTKSAKRTDFTHLPPGRTHGSMTFKANEDDLIYGDRFHLDIRLVLLSGDERQRYSPAFDGLTLSP